MTDPKEYYSLITNVDIAEIARDLLGDRITEDAGDILYVDCPVHKSQSRKSLTVDRKKQCWYCFGCGVGGDVLHLVEFAQSGVVTKGAAGAMSSTHRAARDFLAEKAGLPSLSKYNLAPERIEEIEKRQKEEELVFAILGEIAEFYHRKLLANPAALAAFKEQYGISAATVESLKIGFADNDGLLKHLQRDRGRTLAQLSSTGCFYPTHNDQLAPFFDGRFIFPYWKQGKVVYLIGRRTRWTPSKGKYEPNKYVKLGVRNEQRKYISKCVSNKYFYNEDALISNSESVVITEGVTDCISLMERGFGAISPVTVSFREEDRDKLFALVSRQNRVFICQDNEVSRVGLEGALKTARFLIGKGLNAAIVDLPLFDKQKRARKELSERFGVEAGLSKREIADKLSEADPRHADEIKKLLEDAKVDVNEYFLHRSASDFQKLLLSAKGPLEFELQRIPPDLPEEERNKRLDGVLRDIAGLQPIEQERCVGLVHAHFKKALSKKAIYDTIRALKREEKASAKKKFHSDAPEGSCKRLIDQLIFETAEDEGRPNWNKIAGGIYGWFKDHGAVFFHDSANGRFMYFDGRVFSMNPDKKNNPAYLSMLYKHTQLPITTGPTGRMFHEYFDNIAYDDGDLKESHYWLHTDRSRHTVYFNLNNDRNEILKITPDGIDVIQNGVNADNVVMHDNPALRPVEFIPDADVNLGEALFKELIFDNLACPPDERVLVAAWMSCFLLIDYAGTHPLLRFEGSAESGKSTASKLISTLIFGAMNLENPTIAANYTEGAKQPLIVIDNIEIKNATDELIQFLLTAVTGIVRTKRKQGTDTETVRESVRCLINTSGIEPLAGLSELTTRTLLVEFDIANSTHGYLLETETMQRIVDERNVILSAIFKKTQAILKRLHAGGQRKIMKLFADELGAHPKKRCNDYLSLMYLMLLAGMDGKEMEKYTETVHPVFKRILGAQRAMAEAQEVEANPFIAFIVLLVKERLLAIEADEFKVTRDNIEHFNKTYGLKFSGDYSIVDAQARDLHAAFHKFAQQKGMKAPYASAIQLSRRLRNDKDAIERAGIRVEKSKEAHLNATVYAISVPSSFFGKLADAVERVGAGY